MSAVAEPRLAPPTLTAVVEPEPVNNVLLTVTPVAGMTGLYVYRVGPSGVRAGVRGVHPRDVTGDTSVQSIRDFEAPIGVPLTYYAYGVDSGGAPSASVSVAIVVPSAGCEDTWLTDLARPTNTQRVVLESLAELAYGISVGVHNIIARRSPIVSSDIADTPTFELVFITDDELERERARATLGNGIPVLLRTPPENGIGSVYFSVLEFAEQRIVQRATEDDRRFVVSCVQVDRPDPALFLPLGPATYAHVKATFATYADLKAQRASYDALLYDYAGAEAGDVVPWPPVDV